MNPLDRLLRYELQTLLDRVAASLPDGSLSIMTASNPALRARLDETDARLSTLRGDLLEIYAAWGEVLDDLENLWAVAAWKRQEGTAAAA